MKFLILLCLSLASAFTSNFPQQQQQGFASHNHQQRIVSPTSFRPHANHPVLKHANPFVSSTIRPSTINKAAGVDKINGATKEKADTPTVASAFLLLAMDVGFRRLFQTLAITFPSSLGGCCALFISLLTLPGGEAVFQVLSPGAALLAKWLPVFFVPSLVTLPLVGDVGPLSEILKILAVVVGGFFFTLLSTAGSVVGIRKILSSNSDTPQADAVPEGFSADETVPQLPSKPFSDQTSRRLKMATMGTGLAAILGRKCNASFAAPLNALFLLSATLHHFVLGARLPKRFTKVVHPLVTCTTLTWATIAALGGLTGSSFVSLLRDYKTGGTLAPLATGAGDVLLFLLGPAVVSLAISMYDKRRLMKENLVEVGTAVSVGSLGGLFGTAVLVRLLNIASPSVRLSLLSRNITSPLAMAIAGILGADASLAVAMVVVTGLIGANFGASILDAVGIKDAVARGLGIGTAAHGLGTAAIVDEKDAFPFSAIAMALAASACTCLVSIPFLKRAIIQLSLGV